jgi:diguanylate cyclase (GGDEF)-like protein
MQHQAEVAASNAAAKRNLVVRHVGVVVSPRFRSRASGMALDAPPTVLRATDNWPRRWLYPAASVLIVLGAARIGLYTLSLVFVLVGFWVGRKLDELRSSAVTDPMTGLANRREFDTRLRHEIERSLRQQTPLALLLLDVDKLKLINDRGGHAAGDAAIRAVAACLRQVGRTTDLAARLGGDELAVLAPSTTAAEATALAERYRSALRRMKPRFATVSIGIADLESNGSSADVLLAAADDALYAAKSKGGDKVRVAPARPPFWSRPTIQRGTLHTRGGDSFSDSSVAEWIFGAAGER